MRASQTILKPFRRIDKSIRRVSKASERPLTIAANTQEPVAEMNDPGAHSAGNAVNTTNTAAGRQVVIPQPAAYILPAGTPYNEADFCLPPGVTEEQFLNQQVCVMVDLQEFKMTRRVWGIMFPGLRIPAIIDENATVPVFSRCTAAEFRIIMKFMQDGNVNKLICALNLFPGQIATNASYNRIFEFARDYNNYTLLAGLLQGAGCNLFSEQVIGYTARIYETGAANHRFRQYFKDQLIAAFEREELQRSIGHSGGASVMFQLQVWFSKYPYAFDDVTNVLHELWQESLERLDQFAPEDVAEVEERREIAEQDAALAAEANVHFE